jgi:hypothetical protein
MDEVILEGKDAQPYRLLSSLNYYFIRMNLLFGVIFIQGVKEMHTRRY